ncbi:MAG TPA: HAD-IB family hydrolase, partial [Mycobacterium sp.]|nr:HAD-IB family hydrolase [Mycobacterium sp.]
TVINPCTVDVAVFPPISVQDWTVETLPEHIAEVRQLYLDTLADWPVDELPEVDLYAEQKAAKRAKARPVPQAAKTPAKKAPRKTAAKKAAAKPKPAKASPDASKVALKDGEAQQPSVGGTVSAEPPSSPPRGRP